MNRSLFHLGVGIAVDTYIETWRDECTGTLNASWLRIFPNLTSLSIEAQPPNASRELHGVKMPAKLWRLLKKEEARRGDIRKMLNVMQHLWKLAQCSRVISRHENANGFVYDAIVKVRPDSKFWWRTSPSGVAAMLPPLARRMATEYAAWMAEHGTPPGPGRVRDVPSGWVDLRVFSGGCDLVQHMSDKYAVGTSTAMHYYLNVWSSLQIIWQENYTLPRQGWHSEGIMRFHFYRYAEGKRFRVKNLASESGFRFYNRDGSRRPESPLWSASGIGCTRIWRRPRAGGKWAPSLRITPSSSSGASPAKPPPSPGSAAPAAGVSAASHDD